MIHFLSVPNIFVGTYFSVTVNLYMDMWWALVNAVMNLQVP